MIEDTIANSRKIEAMFISVAAYVDDFQRKEGRLPTTSEFDAWKQEQPEIAYGRVYLDLPNNSQDLVRQFGKAAPNSYVLLLWRGEWFEYYASWARKSTVVFDKRSYHILGSSIADGIATAALGIALLGLAGWLWRWPATRSNGRAASGATFR